MILYQDDDVVAITKPAGVIDQYPPGFQGSRRPTAGDYAMKLLGIGPRSRSRLLPVQHLDRDVSGVMVFARTPAAAIKLGEAFRTRRAQRSYTALVCGRPGSDPNHAEGGEPIGTIHTLLVEPRRGSVEAVPIGSELSDLPPGERAPKKGVTHYRVIKSGPALSLLRIKAETDYPMQVRAHLASVGCPVSGDRRYAAPHDPLGRVGLHLGEVTVLHPSTMTELRLRAPVPEAWSAAVDFDPTTPAENRGWDEVADWYADLLAAKKSDLHERVAWPGTLRLLGMRPGERMIDVACGPGDLSGPVLAAGAGYIGVDASPKLVAIGRERGAPGAEFRVGDACDLAGTAAIPIGSFHAAACVLALMNIDDLDAACRSMASVLRPGGRLVAVVLHPAFRSPRLTSWHWDETERFRLRQFRRVDGYLGELAVPITMNPGAAAEGAEPVITTTHHRPLSRYAAALASSGLLIDTIEEWASHRRSRPGPRAAEEDRARAEIPMFLAIRAVRAG